MMLNEIKLKLLVGAEVLNATILKKCSWVSHPGTHAWLVPNVLF
jgi:hypothetical protein